MGPLLFDLSVSASGEADTCARHIRSAAGVAVFKGAFRGALCGLLMGVPHDSVVAYEAVVKADGFLVMAHGTEADMARARAILGTADASQIAVHPGVIALPGKPAMVAA